MKIARDEAMNMVSVAVIVVTVALVSFQLGREQGIITVEPVQIQTVTETPQPDPYQQTAIALAQELALYKVQMCGDAWVPGCSPIPNPTIRNINSTTMAVTWNISAYCTETQFFKWDGSGFRISGSIGGCS